jgi:prepilin signal peptidase PulO-like enzyme (type II secretory pathway)
MNIILSMYLFFVGLAFGSFALAMVDRMKTGKDWVKGRSECDNCKHILQPIDLVPLISWLSTKGRCRYCKKKLSVAYPLTEFFVGLAFLFSYLYWPNTLSGFLSIAMFVVWLVALVVMAALFVFDIRWFILPNKLIRPLIALGVIWMIMDIATQGLSVGIVVNYTLAVLVGAGLFLLLFVASKGKWIGDGDIRLGVAIGLFAGNPLGAWFCIFLASTIGVLASIPILFKTKKNKRLKLKIPFGPVLIIALYFTVLFGTQIIDWYKLEVLYL